MTFAFPGIDIVFSTEENRVNCIVIENRRFYYRVVKDLSEQILGSDGEGVISSNGKTADFSKKAELLNSFFPFDLNKKNLISKIGTIMEQRSQTADLYIRTSELLSDIEKYIDELAFDFPCDISCEKLSVSSLIKSAGIEIVDDSETLAERILNYMALSREFEGNKLFFTVNLRSFVDDDDMNEFMKCVLMHQYDVIMFENCSYPLCGYEKRFTVDSDLCCF